MDPLGEESKGPSGAEDKGPSGRGGRVGPKYESKGPLEPLKKVVAIPVIQRVDGNPKMEEKIPQGETPPKVVDKSESSVRNLEISDNIEESRQLCDQDGGDNAAAGPSKDLGEADDAVAGPSKDRGEGNNAAADHSKDRGEGNNAAAGPSKDQGEGDNAAAGSSKDRGEGDNAASGPGLSKDKEPPLEQDKGKSGRVLSQGISDSSSEVKK